MARVAAIMRRIRPALGAVPTLVVYGTKDEIVPREPVDAFVARLPERVRVAVYDSGYHMLLRDLKAQKVLNDVLAFIEHPGAPLESQADIAGEALFDRLDRKPPEQAAGAAADTAG